MSEVNTQALADSRPDGGELLARTLAAAGVKRIFALHGGHLESFWQACRRYQIELNDFRHESSAGHAADAYARTTGDLGVCVVTSGPGFTNVISAITNAYLDAVPVLFIVGAPPLRDVETNPLQGGIDQIMMVGSTTKWAHRITHTERIPELTAQAVRTCRNGRPGSVLLEVPIDVLHIPVDESRVTAPTGLQVRTAPAPRAEEVSAIIDMLKHARRPAIFVGHGIRFGRAEAPLRQFAEAAGIPVFCGGHGYGALPYQHPLWGKDLALLGSLPLLGEPGIDALLVIGARLGLFTGGRNEAVIPADIPIAQIDLHAPELGRLREVQIPVLADAGVACQLLAEAAAQQSWPDWSGWVRTATGLKAMGATMFADLPAGDGPIHPWAAMQILRAGLPGDAIYVLDGGETSAWTHMALEVDRSEQVIGAGYHGCLGVGPGMAIGAQLAHPQRQVVHITGDGAMGFHIQEFDTQIRQQLPVLTVIFNNQLWGMSAHGQDLIYGENERIITELGQTDYAAIARAFGCHGERVECLAELAPALQRALAAGRAACLEIMTDPSVVHPAMPAMVGADGKAEDEIMIPYYDNIKLG